MDIRHNGRWHGLGAVDVLAPGTAESRSPDSGLPILLGRDGFFDRRGVCLDRAGKTFQIGRAGGWTRRAGGRGRLRARAPWPAHPSIRIPCRALR